MSQDPKQGESPSAMRRRGAATRWGQPAPVTALPPVVKASEPVAPAKQKPKKGKPSWSAVQTKRISEITRDAVAAYNEILARPNGRLQRVTDVGIEKRREDVYRCMRAASRICQKLYGSPQITLTFWQQYFKEVNRDDFRSGRKSGGPGHENWKPTFKYLTREDTVVDVFEKAVTDE